MRIRPLRPEDHDAVGELTADAYARVDPATVEGAYDAQLRDVAARSNGVEILVAVDTDASNDGDEHGPGERILGAVTFVPGPDSPGAEFSDRDAAGIRMLAVAADARRRGVGEALTRACIERARATGRGQIVLHSTDRMTDAHRLYLRLGFVRDRSLDWEGEPGLWLRGFRIRLEDAPPPG
jgi:ribosomal protein S18 acetylase RimI-like enzyme